MMDPLFWERAHGGLTHFPIALIFVATFFDVVSFFRDRSGRGRAFNAVGYWLLILAGIGAVAAVISGLALSKWTVIGTGLVRLHHLFVWPAFVLIVGLVLWRVAARNKFSRGAFVSYLIAASAACALIGGAGFVGGEMLLAEPMTAANSSPVSLADAEQGRHLFLMNCAHCHGDDARGDEGPDLHDLRKSDARIHQVVTGGIKGEMPSFAKKLGETEIRQLTAYLRTLRG
jgi:mono/diheme cytochrome c family protein